MNDESALFKLSQTYFQSIMAELSQAGLRYSPTLELCESDGLLCYYDLNTQMIHLSMPDKNTPQARLQLLLLRSLFACETDEEVFDFLRLVLYWLLCHEVAHHLRHYHGLLSGNVWYEEEIANQLALAMSKPRFTTEERFHTHRLLQRTTQNLARKVDTKNSPANPHLSIAPDLNTGRGKLQPNIFSHLYYYFASMDTALMNSESFTIHEFAQHYLFTSS